MPSINHISFHLSKSYEKTMAYDFRHRGPDLGQAQKYGGVKPVNGDTTLLFPITMHI